MFTNVGQGSLLPYYTDVVCCIIVIICCLECLINGRGAKALILKGNKKKKILVSTL